ncbi:hypothetical protein SAMN05446037_101392 [Anaerovirgula multivorans]|uniref:GGDEF domain-containing protein, diguanylate cyclase (C-di-GMP synthetase) or its enzymatically inactive variants n=1 Tax=Anaerovirgula multivorans TaxID=312168 RepID=A0A239FME2_9FIRM|nr:hypothetical protein [Anaerovirgula multivorans]SNS57971.1 hypothetical protein SAMN05446037_101392 [Anaerovirgula multivorans]
MKNSKWQTFLHIGQFLLFYITIFHFFSSDKQIFFIGQYIIFIILFKILSKRSGFILLIAYNLLIALGYLFIGFIEMWEALRQLEGIVNHLVLILNIAVLYGFTYIAKSVEEENVELKERVEELTQYIGSSEMLTKQEYKRRSSLIKKAMERRGELGYEIQFSVKEKNLHVQKAVFNTLTNLALATFRNQYDLVGKWSKDSFVVLLQNTDEAGMEIALNRYYTRINEKLNIKEEELIMDIQVIGKDERQVNTA